MGYELGRFSGIGLDAWTLDELIARHEDRTLPALAALWGWYRNPMSAAPASEDGRSYRLGQERGLPSRVTGRRSRGVGGALMDDRVGGRREVVIENDIAWRVHTMVDFMFGRPVKIASAAEDPERRERIESALERVWEASGGIGLLQDMALLGHVYGHVDLLVRVVDGSPRPEERVRIEVIEPTRGIPVVDRSDFRRLDGYVVRYRRGRGVGRDKSARAGRLRLGRRAANAGSLGVDVTEVIGASWWQVYEDHGRGPVLVGEGPNRAAPGEVPVVHVQNMSQPFCYTGLGEVEGLIPLQDELNTRLSDRANRVALQSFKMYLAKGMEGFERMPVAPGVVWSTDNPDASVEAFGGDGSSPSEERHVEEVRTALDKLSGVPPLAGGVVQGKIGNLSSATALRVTLMSLLLRTERKRVTYGRGVREASRMVLAALDGLGVLRTEASEREVGVQWPDPLPVGDVDEVLEARRKVELGVDPERVLRELGYAGVGEGVA